MIFVQIGELKFKIITSFEIFYDNRYGFDVNVIYNKIHDNGNQECFERSFTNVTEVHLLHKDELGGSAFESDLLGTGCNMAKPYFEIREVFIQPSVKFHHRNEFSETRAVQ